MKNPSLFSCPHAAFACCAAVLLAFGVAPAHAQQAPPAPSSSSDGKSDPGTVTNGADGFFQVRCNGGHYMARLGRISSVSKHVFMVPNAGMKVCEVTVAMDSAVVARFYFSEALGKNSALTTPKLLGDKLTQLGTTVAGRADSDFAGGTVVVKDYPNTTHAHTVEYSLKTQASLDSMYDALANALATGRSIVWSEN